jgi:hypothetical protein
MAYNGRRGPNVSEYIANLNAIPSAQDLQSSENFNMEDELAMFTNTQFFDFDLGQDADLQPSFDGARGSQEIGSELKPLDFIPGESAFSCHDGYCSCFYDRCYSRLYVWCLHSASKADLVVASLRGQDAITVDGQQRKYTHSWLTTARVLLHITPHKSINSSHPYHIPLPQHVAFTLPNWRSMATYHMTPIYQHLQISRIYPRFHSPHKSKIS